MRAKPNKVVASKNLSGLDGVCDVTFGSASCEQRMNRNFSKEAPAPVSNSLEYDDHKERRERWEKAGFGIG